MRVCVCGHRLGTCQAWCGRRREEDGNREGRKGGEKEEEDGEEEGEEE